MSMSMDSISIAAWVITLMVIGGATLVGCIKTFKAASKETSDIAATGKILTGIVFLLMSVACGIGILNSGCQIHHRVFSIELVPPAEASADDGETP